MADDDDIEILEVERDTTAKETSKTKDNGRQHAETNDESGNDVDQDASN